MSRLADIQGPEDLKELSIDALNRLADEARHRIIDVMAINGGHLGSNMGSVELTIALHKVFNSPFDRFIFDVGHQTYTHKLLTGRQENFHTIRQFKGLSGFSHPEESPHDHFFTGHAGTALSLSLGVAKARDLNKETFHIIPILGDATLTCGLTMEALNNLPKNLRRFICILNDNNMSISNNVGAITEILGGYPSSSKAFFEQYGWDYHGPIDGHDMGPIIEQLQTLKETKKPVLLHLLTVKGKGVEAAELDPIGWHGCAPFDKVTGKKHAVPVSLPKFPKIFGSHLLKMAERNPEIIAITPAMPLGSAITEFMERFPDRCIDVGIAEGHAVTFSGAIAQDPSKKVICCIYATFLQRAFDNLFQDVCLQKSPVIFALDRSGIATGDGATHHGIYDIGLLSTMPNMVICQPRNGVLLKELMESAFLWKRPTAIRYPNMTTEDGHQPLQNRPLGKGEILQKGAEVALIALGHMEKVAFEVSSILTESGISPTIVDPIFVKPLDADLLTSLLMSHSIIVTIEEHSASCGMGALINGFAAVNGLNTPLIKNFGIPETFIEQGNHKETLSLVGLDATSIAQQILFDLSGIQPMKAPSS